MPSRNEAARQLGVSLRTLARLIASGEIAIVRIGRRVLVPQSAIDAFIVARLRRSISATTAGEPS